MLVSYGWLKDYIEINDSPAELAEKLTMAGVETEIISEPGAELDSVIIARVVEVRPHPDADKLRICTVSDGALSYEVVCGAPNVEAGKIVALAIPGANLPGGIKIKRAKIRGVQSEGMICSEKELCLSDEHSGIMILADDAPVGKKLSEYEPLRDVVFEASLTPNRPDCLSHIGIARELAAINKDKARLPNFNLIESAEDIHTMASVEIADKDLCPRYAARIIKDITIGPSPEWLVRKLNAVGVRSINNVVDITNFVMMEYGQPLHAFDFSRIRGQKVIVRRAKPGETLETLDGVERKLETDDLLITDKGGGIAIAGVMGGGESEVSDSTKDVFLESAYFAPSAVRRTSRRIGMHTEASHRFERGVDPMGVIPALDRAASLIAKLCKGKILKGAIDEGKKKWERKQVSLRTARVNQILGTSLNKAEIGDMLRRLGIDIITAGEDLACEPPTWRVDLENEIDLIEEVARLFGYNNIEAVNPNAPIEAAPPSAEEKLTEFIRNFGITRGLFEVINYSFESEELMRKIGLIGEGKNRKVVRILNPISELTGVMRNSLVSSLLKSLSFNINRQNPDVKIFEIGHVFSPRESSAELPLEQNLLGFLLSGRRRPEGWASENNQVDFYDLKGIIEDLLAVLHIDSTFKSIDKMGVFAKGRLASIESGKTLLGIIGQVDPPVCDSLDIKQPVFIAELNIDAIIRVTGGEIKYKAIPLYPRSMRDLAIVVDRGLEADEITSAILSSNIKHLEAIKIVDLFQGKGVPEDKKSLAFRFSFRSAEKTLTDSEVEKQTDLILELVTSKFSAELRS